MVEEAVEHTYCAGCSTEMLLDRARDRAMKYLASREEKIMRERVIGKSLREIGLVMHLSGERIRQILLRALWGRLNRLGFWTEEVPESIKQTIWGLTGPEVKWYLENWQPNEKRETIG